MWKMEIIIVFLFWARAASWACDQWHCTALALRMWPCTGCLLPCGHNFHFVLCWRQMGLGGMHWGLHALAPCGPVCACLPRLWKGSGLPLLLCPLPPFASSRAWAWGPGSRISQRFMGLVSGTGEAWAPVKISFHPADTSGWTGRDRLWKKGKYFYPAVLTGEPAFLFCIGSCKLCRIGCFEDWRVVEQLELRLTYIVSTERCAINI